VWIYCRAGEQWASEATGDVFLCRAATPLISVGGLTADAVPNNRTQSALAHGVGYASCPRLLITSFSLPSFLHQKLLRLSAHNSCSGRHTSFGAKTVWYCVDRANQLQTLVISTISKELYGITSSIFSYPTSLRLDGRRRQLPPHFFSHFEHVAFLPDRFLCLFLGLSAVRSASTNQAWLLASSELLGVLSNPFWRAPTTMQYFSHGNALSLAREISIVTPTMGKEYNVLSHLPRRLTRSEWARHTLEITLITPRTELLLHPSY
jgi:hypothetical protein